MRCIFACENTRAAQPVCSRTRKCQTAIYIAYFYGMRCDGEAHLPRKGRATRFRRQAHQQQECRSPAGPHHPHTMWSLHQNGHLREE